MGEIRIFEFLISSGLQDIRSDRLSNDNKKSNGFIINKKKVIIEQICTCELILKWFIIDMG